MSRKLRAEEAGLWRRVALGVDRLPGREPPPEPPAAPSLAGASAPADAPRGAMEPRRPVRRTGPLHTIEPRRLRRLSRGRDALGPRLDLHGLDQDHARAAVHDFIVRASAEGWRSVLIITGQGLDGSGVLRRRLPDWLAESPSRVHVAGVSEAHRRHGGRGAVYVALRASL